VKLEALHLVLSGQKAELRFELAKTGRLCIGRDRESDLVISDRTVSRAHATIGVESGRLVLRDLGSSNGTFVNEEPTLQRALFPGDRIRFGEVEFLVQLRLADETQEVTDRETGAVPLKPREALWGQETKILGGRVADLSVVDLVQVLATGGKSGVLLLYDGHFGRIDLWKGEVCFAEVDGATGEKAFFRLVLWPRAEFEFHSAAPHRNSITRATHSLLIEGLRLQGDLDELRRDLPHEDSVLALSPTRRVPPGLSRAEIEVLQWTVKLKTLAHVVESSPLPDVQIYAAVVRLLAVGILVDTTRSGESERDTLEIPPERNPLLNGRARAV